jgi:hypothetical protein
VTDQRGRLLIAALGFAGLPRPSYDRSLWALRTWLDSWSGAGRIAIGMAVTTALMSAGCATGGVLDASWVAPTTNMDGSPLSEVVTYRLYYDTTDTPCISGKSIRVATSQTLAPGQKIVFRLTGLTIGELYYAAVAAVNSRGLEGECSTAASARARQP